VRVNEKRVKVKNIWLKKERKKKKNLVKNEAIARSLVKPSKSKGTRNELLLSNTPLQNDCISKVFSV